METQLCSVRHQFHPEIGAGESFPAGGGRQMGLGFVPPVTEAKEESVNASVTGGEKVMV